MDLLFSFLEPERSHSTLLAGYFSKDLKLCPQSNYLCNSTMGIKEGFIFSGIEVNGRKPFTLNFDDGVRRKLYISEAEIEKLFDKQKIFLEKTKSMELEMEQMFNYVEKKVAEVDDKETRTVEKYTKLEQELKSWSERLKQKEVIFF